MRESRGTIITVFREPDASAGRPSVADFPALTRVAERAGVFRPRPWAYLRILLVNVVLVAVGVTTFVALGPSWWQMLTALLWGVVSTQLAFVGHDAGHKQVLRTRRANDVVGYVHGALVGMSYGAWVGKHNRHHARPNHVDDPDLDIPLLAFDHDQAAGARGLTRWVIAHQAVLFVPLLVFEGWSLHITSVLAVWRGELRRRRLEATLLALHAVGYVAALLLVLTPLQAVVFAVVHQGAWGVHMGLAFAPNHKGMPTIEPGRKLDHLHKQVLTSRNVRGGPLTDFVMGGLNYQIEHHLFPWLPRPSLRHAEVVVRAFCVEHGLPHTEAGPVGSYVAVLRHLHAVGATVRAAETRT